jgi:hypothetical protein
LVAAVAMTQPVTACRAAVRRPFPGGARSPATAPFLGEPVLRMFLVGCQCRRPRPVRGQIRTKAPLPDIMPGRFTGAVFVAEEKRLGAGFRCRRRATLSDLRRRGALMALSVDCYGQGMTRPGPGWACRAGQVVAGTGLVNRLVDAS